MTTIAAQRRVRGRPSLGKTGTQDIPINALYIDKSVYYNVPKRQRSSNVWGTVQRQLFIDSVLREDAFLKLTPVVYNIVWEPQENGKPKMIYSIEDGLQRLTTIYLFLDNKLPTMSEKVYRDTVLVEGLEPLPFSTRFTQLPDEMKQRFLRYTLPSLVTEDADPRIAAERYRRRNMQKAHTPGEILKSFESEATELAAKVGAHPIWQPLREQNRRKPRSYEYEMSLYIIYLFIHGNLAQLNRKVLTVLASGRDDTNILNLHAEERILEQLDQAQKVCYGINVTAKTDAIAMWQMVQYLRKATCDFEASTQGCLKDWFEKAKYTPNMGQLKLGNLNVYASLPNMNVQIEFWSRQKAIMLSQPGLVFHDEQAWRETKDGKQREEKILVPVDLESGVVLTERDRKEVPLSPN